MDTIPDAVRRQALHAFSTLPPVPGWRVVEGTYVFAALHPLPYPQPIEPRDALPEANVDAAVAEARALVREHGREVLIWVTGPDHPWLADALAQRGLRNEDSPGFESVENAMALVDTPAGGGGGEDVQVVIVDSFEEFVESTRVELAAFDVPADGRTKMEAELDERFAEYTAAGNPYRRWMARLEDRVVTRPRCVPSARQRSLGGRREPRHPGVDGSGRADVTPCPRTDRVRVHRGDAHLRRRLQHDCLIAHQCPRDVRVDSARLWHKTRSSAWHGADDRLDDYRRYGDVKLDGL